MSGKYNLTMILIGVVSIIIVVLIPLIIKVFTLSDSINNQRYYDNSRAMEMIRRINSLEKQNKEILEKPEPEPITFEATGYCACKKCTNSGNGITASGVKAKAGVTIAANRGYAFGTKIKIKDNVYIVQDRGGAIKGNKLDIYFNTHEEALRFGRQILKGEVVIE